MFTGILTSIKAFLGRRGCVGWDRTKKTRTGTMISFSGLMSEGYYVCRPSTVSPNSSARISVKLFRGQKRPTCARLTPNFYLIHGNN